MKKLPHILTALALTLGAGAIYIGCIAKSPDWTDSVDAKLLPTDTVQLLTEELSLDGTERSEAPLELSHSSSSTNSNKTGYYQVFSEGEYIMGFGKYEDALELAQEYENAHISAQYGAKRVWDNYPPFVVYTTNTEHRDFNTFKEAAAFAKEHSRAFMYHNKDDSQIWNNADPLPESKKISGITRIEQKPELPRGCEVTSLAMLINYKGIKVSKLELAGRVDKNPVSLSYSGGRQYCGDPNEGFIGDMYDFSKFGLGVYHAPIAKLLSEYFPYSTVDLTGCEFEDLYYFLCMNRPVWVIINSRYSVLPDSEFQTWITPTGGEIKITYSEHSALVTGYDNDNIYFLDPLNEITSLEKGKFIAMWEQMGRQAVSVSN